MADKTVDRGSCGTPSTDARVATGSSLWQGQTKLLLRRRNRAMLSKYIVSCVADFEVVDWMVGSSPSRKWRRRQRRARRECHLRRARFRHQQLSDCKIVGSEAMNVSIPGPDCECLWRWQLERV